MKDKKAGVQTMPCVVFALRASNASKAKSNKTNNNFKHMSNSIKFPLSGVEKYLFNKKTKFVVDPSLPEIIFHSEDNFSFFQLCQQRRLLQLPRGWRNSCFKCVLPPNKLQKRCPSTHRWEPTI